MPPRWTKKLLKILHERLDYLAEVADTQQRIEAGLIECPAYAPYSLGRIGSYAHDDPIRHEMCRNLLQHTDGGPIMWIGDVVDDYSLTYWFDNNELQLGVFPTRELVDVRANRTPETVPQMYRRSNDS